jgi:hypothetical protein
MAPIGCLSALSFDIGVVWLVRCIEVNINNHMPFYSTPTFSIGL